jgi:hypothetical protein
MSAIALLTLMGEWYYLAEVDFIKHDLVRVCDGVEAGCKGEDSDDSKSELVVPIIGSGLLGLALQLRKVVAGLVDSIVNLLFGAGRWPLPGAHRRRHGGKKLLNESRESACRSETKHHPPTRQIKQ